MKRQQVVLIAVFALFMLPIIASMLIVQNPEWLADSGTGNRGTLIEPPRMVDARGLIDIDGEPLNNQFFDAMWTLVHISKICDESCQTALYKMRQSRLAVGREIGKVQQLIILTRVPETDVLQAMIKDHPHLTIAFVDESNASPTAFYQVAGVEAVESQGVFIVDPRSYLMMHYESSAPPQDLLADLKHLLRASKLAGNK